MATISTTARAACHGAASSQWVLVRIALAVAPDAPWSRPPESGEQWTAVGVSPGQAIVVRVVVGTLIVVRFSRSPWVRSRSWCRPSPGGGRQRSPMMALLWRRERSTRSSPYVSSTRALAMGRPKPRSLRAPPWWSRSPVAATQRHGDQSERSGLHHRLRIWVEPTHCIQPQLQPRPDRAEPRDGAGRRRRQSRALQRLSRRDAPGCRRLWVRSRWAVARARGLRVGGALSPARHPERPGSAAGGFTRARHVDTSDTRPRRGAVYGCRLGRPQRHRHPATGRRLPHGLGCRGTTAEYVQRQLQVRPDRAEPRHRPDRLRRLLARPRCRSPGSASIGPDCHRCRVSRRSPARRRLGAACAGVVVAGRDSDDVGLTWHRSCPIQVKPTSPTYQPLSPSGPLTSLLITSGIASDCSGFRSRASDLPLGATTYTATATDRAGNYAANVATQGDGWRGPRKRHITRVPATVADGAGHLATDHGSRVVGRVTERPCVDVAGGSPVGGTPHHAHQTVGKDTDVGVGLIVSCVG